MQPVVGIPCCTSQIGPHPFHIVGDKYIRAVAEGSGCLPLLIPALGDWYEIDHLLDQLDGVLFTGSPSNVEPHHYDGAPAREGVKRDPARDATTLPLMARVLERGIPMFAICRGFQELNVVLGGSLHQHLAEVPERFDHHPDPDRALEIQYGPSHAVRLTPDGMLAELLDVEEITVNSIHHQGIDRLADRLAVEGVAPDGQVEAVTVRQTRGFALGVQWHPEWRLWENADSAKLFEAFGAACAMRAAQRLADAAA